MLQNSTPMTTANIVNNNPPVAQLRGMVANAQAVSPTQIKRLDDQRLRIERLRRDAIMKHMGMEQSEQTS